MWTIARSGKLGEHLQLYCMLLLIYKEKYCSLYKVTLCKMYCMLLLIYKEKYCSLYKVTLVLTKMGDFVSYLCSWIDPPGFMYVPRSLKDYLKEHKFPFQVPCILLNITNEIAPNKTKVM